MKRFCFNAETQRRRVEPRTTRTPFPLPPAARGGHCFVSAPFDLGRDEARPSKHKRRTEPSVRLFVL